MLLAHLFPVHKSQQHRRSMPLPQQMGIDTLASSNQSYNVGLPKIKGSVQVVRKVYSTH